jgi:hypothetical protein
MWPLFKCEGRKKTAIQVANSEEAAHSTGVTDLWDLPKNKIITGVR